MKRLCAACLVLLILCGCAQPAAEPSPGPSPTSAPVLAFFGSATQLWSQGLGEAAADWCAETGWELVEYDCAGVAATQTVQVADLKRTQGAALAVLCDLGDREALEENAAALKAGGISVITLSDRAVEPPRGALCHLGPDNGEILEIAGEFFQGERVVILHDVDADPLEAAAGDALEGAGAPVAEESYTWGDPDYAQMFLTDVLTRQSQVGGVLCFSPAGAAGAHAALRAAGRREETRILCLDSAEELAHSLARGELDGLVTLSAQGTARALTEALTQAAGERTPPGQTLPVELRRPPQP